MIQYPQIDPILVAIPTPFGFDFPIRWYGLMYLIGFSAAYFLAMSRAKKPTSPVMPEQVTDLVFYGALGAVLGGRIGYMFVYNFDGLLADPTDLFRVWEGGMSFHGGLLGVGVGGYLYARSIGRGLWEIWDFCAPLAPIGLGCGRIGNFIGAELYGRATDLPWAMVFPNSDGQPRHPSQLYQCFLEGFVLFCILWWYTSKPRPEKSTVGVFLFFYGSFRFLVEFARQPDAHLGFLAWNWVTMGQLLSLPMILGGAALFVYAHKTASSGVPKHR